MAAGAGLGLAAAVAGAAQSSWFNPANPSDPHTSVHAPILVAHGDAWHNSANASLPPAAQAHMNATGHHIPAPPPRKRPAEFFSLDEDGFTADDDLPASSSTALPRGIRRPAAAAAASGDRGKKGKVLHGRKWESKDRAPSHPSNRSKFQALPTEPIQGFSSSSESSGIVVATTRPPPPPPPPPEQGNGYIIDHGTSSRSVRPHALPQHRPADPFTSGSDGPGASAGPGSLKTLQSALKWATKAKETMLGPMATNYRNTSTSTSSSSNPPPPKPPPPAPPQPPSRDRNTYARSGQQ